MRIKQLTSPFIKMFLLGVVVAVLMFSCKREYSTISLTSDAVAEFVPVTGSFVNSYYIKSTNDPYLIPVGLTNFSNTDRTIDFTVSSNTAVAGQQYTAPSPVTIKAGETLDTLRFQGIFAGYTGGRIDTVTIKITGYSTVNGQDSIQLVLRPYCDVIGNDLTGDYTHTTDYYPAAVSAANASASQYTATISSWTPLTATTASIVIQNLGLTQDVGFGPFASTDPAESGLTATVDWTDPSNFKVTLPSQSYIAGNLYGYGPATISGSGSFSSCDQIFTITYTVKVSAGSFYPTLTQLVR